MDITTRIITQKKIDTDASTGLDRYAQIVSVNIDGANNGLITVKGRIALLSPTFVAMHIEGAWEFTRFDRPASVENQWVVDTPAVFYETGEDMGNGLLAQGGEVKVAEVGHFEDVTISPANLKYSLLEQSAIGLGIKQMLGVDLNNGVVNEIWNIENLIQN